MRPIALEGISSHIQQQNFEGSKLGWCEDNVPGMVLVLLGHWARDQDRASESLPSSLCSGNGQPTATEVVGAYLSPLCGRIFLL